MHPTAYTSPSRLLNIYHSQNDYLIPDKAAQKSKQYPIDKGTFILERVYGDIDEKGWRDHWDFKFTQNGTTSPIQWFQLFVSIKDSRLNKEKTPPTFYIACRFNNSMDAIKVDEILAAHEIRGYRIDDYLTYELTDIQNFLVIKDYLFFNNYFDGEDMQTVDKQMQEMTESYKSL